MSSYVDIETSAEALQEDEELQQAVEELIETAAVSVWSEIVHDLQEMCSSTRSFLETLFPVLIDYRQDRSRVQEDFEKVALFAVLFVIAFFILTPWRKFSSRKQTRGGGWLMLARRESNSSLQASSPRDGLSVGEESETASDRMMSEDETDEERFEKVWPSIAMSQYRKLVLPPTCKHVDKPMSRRIASRVPTELRSETDNKKQKTSPDSSDNKNDDDDNPARRLQTYLWHFWYLIESLLSYDYAGAGRTLITWMQGIRRHQRRTKTERTTQDEHEHEDEEASVKSESGAPAVETGTGSATPPFATPTASEEQQMPSENDAYDSTKKQLHTTLSILAEGDDEEEKKDLGGDSPMSLPLIPRSFAVERPESERSIYHETLLPLDTNNNDLGEEQAERCHHHSPTLPRTPLRPRSNSDRSPMQALEEVYYGPGNDDFMLDEQQSSPLSSPISPPPADGPPTSPPSIERTTSSPKTQQEQVVQEGDVEIVPIPLSESGRERALRAKEEKESGQSYEGNEGFFFETVHSQASLKKLSIQVPVPDKNGYILGDDFLPDLSYTPLLVFVNSRAGPQQGHLLITQLRRLLNPIQIWDLANGGPETVLESFLVLTRLRILVCGGDGTVSWIISALEKMNLKRKWPPIAILPLGTGNDLARIHGWGGGYNNESLITILEQISESYISLLDRWEVTIEDRQTKKKEVKTFYNYVGVGADAQAALQVHYLRESRPEWFFSRLVNKAWYGVFGAEDIIMASSVNVRKEIKLFADGVEVQLPSDSQGIIILNIDSYAGGVPLWSHGTKAGTPRMPFPRLSPRRSKSMELLGRRSNSMDRVDSSDDLFMLLPEEDRFARVTACDRPSSCQDGILEVVSIRGAFHLGQIKVGLSNAQRLCQCREATVTIKNKVAVQIDGEPWRQRPCTLRVKRKEGPVSMLHRSVDDGGVETEMSKLLDWAEERQLIDGQVHLILMKEFSRRIESKTRKRRVREQDNIMHTLKKAISQGAMANMQGSQSWQGGIAF